MFTEDYQKMLRARSMNNRGALLDSKECGCFFCLKLFDPAQIRSCSTKRPHYVPIAMWMR